METKKSFTSKKVPCNICGKQVFARGLASHVRLLHGEAKAENNNNDKPNQKSRLTKIVFHFS